MKKRLIIYFNYHPNGQADAACRFAVQQMAAVGQVFFVNNGPLQSESRQWAQGCCHTVLERENTGFDVGAYRDAVLQIGLDTLLQYDEVVLMNYTLAGPVGDVAAMFAVIVVPMFSPKTKAAATSKPIKPCEHITRVTAIIAEEDWTITVSIVPIKTNNKMDK